MASITRPATQWRILTLLDQGFQQPGDVEDRLGFSVGQLGRDRRVEPKRHRFSSFPHLEGSRRVLVHLRPIQARERMNQWQENADGPGVNRT